MTKVEMEKPVVSNELANRFERLKNDYYLYPSESCDSLKYSHLIPENKTFDVDGFEQLLIKMYVLGYEIEKPKLKYIRLNSNHINVDNNYLNFSVFDCVGSENYRVDNKYPLSKTKTKFTQKQVDEFLKDEPSGMWIVEEVEDQ